MDVLTILKILVRRWWVLLPMVAVTVAVVGYVGTTMEDEYEMEGSLLLSRHGPSSTDNVESADDGEEETGEATVIPALNTVLMAERIQSGDVRDRLREQGAGAPYRVSAERDGLLRVTASGSDDQQVVDTVNAVLDTIAEEAADATDQGESPTEILNRPTSAESGVEPVDGEMQGNYFAAGSILVRTATTSNPYQPDPYTLKVLEQVMISDEGRQRVAALGAMTEYEVSLNSREPAPLMYVTSLGTEPEQVKDTYATVVGALQDELERRQEEISVPVPSRTALEPLATPMEPVPASGSKLRPLIAILGVGLFSAVTFTLLIDAVLSRRRFPTLERVPADREGIDSEFQSLRERAGL